jgi:SAM-dependent methyltransferase
MNLEMTATLPLEKMQSNTCLVCKGKKVHYDFSIGRFRVEECADCGLMRLNPQPTDSELAKIYNSNYFIFNSDVTGQLHVAKLKSSTADRYLDLLESYVGGPLNGNLLEIGCGHGDFLTRAADRGLTVTGVEYSQHAVDIAANKIGKRGQVICGEINDVVARGGRYDFIVFADVLEHVRDPEEFLQQVHLLLVEGGIAGVIVPSLDSFSAKFMKNKWVEFKPEHLWYFSKATLRQLLYRKGFTSLKAHAAKKTLSFDYVAQHFDHYPIQPYTTIIKFICRLLPSFVKKYPLHVAASGIVMFARREEMTPIKKLSVILPAYNEEKTIEGAIERVLSKRIPHIEIEIIIVESNSSDKTRDIVRQYEGHERVKVIWQDKARGKGHAVQAGLVHVSGDYILIQDADDEYDIEDYDALVEPLLSGEAAFVLGARHGGRAWKMRQFNGQRFAGHILNFGHWFFTLLVNVVYGLRLKDPFTMYKVFRVDCLRGLTFQSARFDFDFELLIKLVRKGYKPIEIPVNYRSRSFMEGKKVNVFRDPWTWLWAIVKFRFQKI